MTKLKQEKEFVTQSETFGGIRASGAEHELEAENYAGETGSKKKGTAFLKMFRFDKARTSTGSTNKELNELQPNEQRVPTDVSIDYAKYLVEISDSK